MANGGPTLIAADRREHVSAADPRLEAPLEIEALFRAHFDDVYRMVGRLLGPGAGAADIEDLTQQVFLAAHQALPRFRGDSKVTTWLGGIAIKVVLVQLRSWRRRRRLIAALEAQPDLRAPVPPDVRLAEQEQLLEVWRCLIRIKPEKRVVYLLYEVEEKPAAEIAELLAIPRATVFSRLSKAREELRQMLSKRSKR
jgi:RNA polymerase sigma-70 factor (ECF subfamily)